MKLKNIQRLRLPYRFKIKFLWGALIRLTSFLENRAVDKIKPQKINDGLNEDKEKVIVSLTSFPARINRVSKCIKTLLNQDAHIDGIYLWLAEEQFPDRKLPEELESLCRYGLKIRYCEDLRSHKKYYYTMLEEPDAIVITVDDDILYPEDTVDRLMKYHRLYPDAVICNNGRWIECEDGKYVRYKHWKRYQPMKCREPSASVLPIGMGAVLYPPNSLDKEKLFDKKMIMEQVLYTDDLWLKYMAAINGTKALMTSHYSKPFVEISGNDPDYSLKKINVDKGNNDEVLKLLDSIYPEVVKCIQQEEKS